MTTKYFCNLCGKEVSGKKTSWMLTSGKVSVGISQGLSLPASTEDDVHCCKYCIVDLINEHLDDRPRAAAP
jgi:hypothetical protein